MHDDAFAFLLPRLLDLEGVRQDPRFHPEGDALYHSLQVFDVAQRETSDPVLLAAALFHDLGKASAGAEHAEVGADLLEDVASPDVCWLVRHHLDLLRAPRDARAALRGSPRLTQLEVLRRWDLAGRRRHVRVSEPERALGILLEPGVAEFWLAHHRGAFTNATPAVMEDAAS